MRPKAHGGRVVLLALLLVTSMVAAPIGTGTAAAQTDAETCIYDSVPIADVLFGCAPEIEQNEIESDLDEAEAKTQMLIEGSSTYDRSQSYHTVLGNYLEDMPTIASLEAKHALASAYENDSTALEADAAATSAINDYFATHQVNLLNELSAQEQQLAHYANYTQNHPDISENWFYISDWYDGGDGEGISGVSLTGDTTTVEMELANGSTEEVTHSTISYTASSAGNDPISQVQPITLDRPTVDRYFRLPADDEHAFQDYDAFFSGQYRMQGEYQQGDISDTKVFEMMEWKHLWDDLEDQQETAQANYPDGFAEDVFAAFDSGEITPEEFRGAEGMARYLSGDSNVTDQRHYLATTSLLDLERPALNTTMVIEYDAATEYEAFINESTGDLQRNYTYETGVAEGVLFADLNTSSVAKNTTYQVGADGDTSRAMIVTGNESVTLHDGNFTVLEMFDQSGGEVENADWSNPEYETYNSSEYIAQLGELTDLQKQILEQSESGGDGGDGIDWGDLLPGGDLFEGIGDTASAVVGGVILVGVIALIARVSGN